MCFYVLVGLIIKIKGVGKNKAFKLPHHSEISITMSLGC